MQLNNNVKIIDVIQSVSNLDNNFLPDGTVIKVELDGSGDFTNLTDALSYINGKYSNGEVIIRLGNGTFNIDTNTRIDGISYNIPVITIKGTDKNSSIIASTGNKDFDYIIAVSNQIVYFKSCAFLMSNGSKSTMYRGLIASSHSNVTICEGTKFTNCFQSFCAYNNGQGLITGVCDVNNTPYGITAISGTIYAGYGTTFNFNDVTTAFSVICGGQIGIENGCTCNKTNVTNTFSKSKGSYTNDGYISAPF